MTPTDKAPKPGSDEAVRAAAKIMNEIGDKITGQAELHDAIAAEIEIHINEAAALRAFIERHKGE